jgi:hypothetical protein
MRPETAPVASRVVSDVRVSPSRIGRVGRPDSAAPTPAAVVAALVPTFASETTRTRHDPQNASTPLIAAVQHGLRAILA